MNAVLEPSPALDSDEALADPPHFSPGVFYDMPAEQYHAVEAMSASGAKQILRSAMHYRFWRDHPAEPTDSMRLGTAAHLAILEPDKFESGISVCPQGLNARTKAGKDALADLKMQAESEKKLLVTAEQYDRCCRMRDAVRRHRGAERLLLDDSYGTKTEVSLFWTDAGFGVPCKARDDVLRKDGGIVDLKTTVDASEDAFGRTIASYQYHTSAAHYMSGAEHVFGKTPPFFAFIAVESDPPHGVACYVLQPNQILAGVARMNRALARYQIALERGYWEGYSPLIEAAKMPAYALRESN